MSAAVNRQAARRQQRLSLKTFRTQLPEPALSLGNGSGLICISMRGQILCQLVESLKTMPVWKSRRQTP